MTEFWNAIKSVFTEPHWVTYCAEWVFLFLLIYFVFRILKEHNARILIAIYTVVTIVVGIIFLFSRNFDDNAYFIFLLLLSMFFLLLFSTEIKRTIWTGKGKRVGTDSRETTAKSAVSARAEEYIGAIIKAVQNLSKNNTGALIVLSNGNLPKEILDSGVLLGANISNQLIEGIFINKAPLHDGAMIIYGDKIQAAGCFLPLTQRDFPKDFGTRHRAGIGITEVADVSTIIVSEETGIVSVVKRGEITRYADSEVLKKFLREYYWKQFSGEGKKA